MFEKLKGAMKQFQMVQRLMKDDNFRALMSHPKVQELFRDPQFLEALKTQDPTTIQGNPKLAALMNDPDLAALMATFDPAALQSLLQADADAA